MLSFIQNAKGLVSKKNSLIFLLFLILGLASFNIFSAKSQTKINQEQKNPQAFKPNDKSSVLGAKIYISGGKEGYGAGGMIALPSTDEPVVEINSYGTSGTASVDIYQANEDALLDYLTHNKDGKQIKKNADISKFRYIAKTTVELNSRDSSKLLLPISGTGIFFLRITYGSINEESFVVRSDFGTVVKEGDDELIFWGQDFNTRRSVKDGTVKLYNLQDSRKELKTVSFNTEGIAKTNLDPNADIALVQRNEDRAVVPINLRYLNSFYNYGSFKAKQKQTKYFTFTDRPIYRPGDTIYFKSILRDDDDARYSVPSGQVLVKLYSGYGDESIIFSKNYDISGDGAINGEYALPQDAKTGYYRLALSTQGTSESQAYFDVQFFRKPEYSIEVETSKTQLIAGDKSSFTIAGSYFSGQPLSNKKVKYRIYSGDFYEYEYLTDRSYVLGDYRYGFWGGDILTQGEVILNQKGQAEINFEAKLPQSKKSSQVFSIEAEFDDGSGNPAFRRKNVLVLAGEYGIFRKETGNYSVKTGNTLTLPVALVSNRSTVLSNVDLTARIHRENWVSYQEPNKKFPSYKKEEEDLSPLYTKTDSQGNASFTFVPGKAGSYKITVEGKDTRYNQISKSFYLYASSEDQPYYSDQYNNSLTIKADKEKYLPTDTINFTISSITPDRDVFLSLERGRVNRFQIVHLQGKNASVEVPVVNTDVPNIFAKVSSFSSQSYDSGSLNVLVSADSKKVVVNISPNNNKYGPGENVTVKIQTTDISGNPVVADVAFWAVDKSLFEVVDEKPEQIFTTFWNQRYDATHEGHSLEGITVLNAEKGGGCFAEGTPVLMSDGKTKAIDQIKAGDRVLTRESENSSNLVKGTVKNIHKIIDSGYFIINGKLRVTANHKMWVNGTWKEASLIQIGDSLIDPQNKKVNVSSIEWVKGKFTVYNLEIDKYSTFFAGGVWVHNQKGARAIFKDTAYWNPSIHTDISGKAQVTFKLPDNLTTWALRVIAANNETKVGQTAGEIVVTKDLIIRPILPNILRVGDKVKLSALVQNFTEKDQPLRLELNFDSGNVALSSQSLQVKSKDTQQVYWTVDPKLEKDKAKLTFSASSTSDEKISDKVSMEIPVRPFGFPEISAQVGEGPKSFWVKLDPKNDKQKSKITLSLASNLIGTLPTAMKYLIEYPYGCVEQTTSRFVPAIIAKLNPDLFASALEDKNLNDIIQKSLTKLSNLQQYDGGWAWWHTGKSDSFVTAYVVEYLALAKQSGEKVDNTLLNNAKRYLEKDEYYDYDTSSYKKYAREDLIAKNYALALLGIKKESVNLENLTPDMLSLAAMTNYLNGDKNPQTNGLAKLSSMAISEGDGVFWDFGNRQNFASNDASTALAIRAIILGGGDRNLAVKGARFLNRNRHSNYWSNTFATAQVTRALVDLAKSGQELTPNYTYSVSLDDKEIAKGEVTSANQTIKDITIPIKDINLNGSNISISKKGTGQIYSTLVVNEFKKDRKAKALNNGLEVKREYVSDKGEEYSLAVGDTVNVKLTVGGLKTNDYYGVIADELPAGLTPINESFKNEQYGQDPNKYYSYDITDREITENGVVLSLYQISGKTKTYTYKARVVSEGTFTVPPATASLMYAPEINGRSEVQTVKTTKESQIVPIKWLKKILGGNLLLILLLIGTGLFILFEEKFRKNKEGSYPSS